MSAHLMVHRGGVRRTREELATLTTPPATATWKPVPHAELVAELVRGLEAQGARVVRDNYCTMGRDDAKLLGTMDLAIPGLDAPDFRMGLGLRGANDKSMAIEVVAAARVFVCDNWAFSGSTGAVFLKKKNTARLDLAVAVPPAVELFLDRAGVWRADIDRMREFALGDGRAKELIFDAFGGCKPVLPIRCLRDVARLYFEDERQRALFPERTLWTLNNAFTEAVKALRPSVQHQAGLRIGRLFGKVLHGGAATMEIPIGLDSNPAAPDGFAPIVDPTAELRRLGAMPHALAEAIADHRQIGPPG
jgi:hypothetical protein